MRYKIKRTKEIISSIVEDNHTYIDSITIDTKPTICDGEDELIEAIVNKTLEMMERRITEYDLYYPEDTFICGYDNRGIGFKANGEYIQYIRILEIDLGGEIDDPQGTCDAVARRLNSKVCDNNAIVIYLEDSKQIRVMPPAGAYYIVNKNYNSISSF